MQVDFTIEAYEQIERHLKQFWSGRACATVRPASGPIAVSLPRFRILRFDPTGERLYWIYCTLGCFEVDSGHNRFEFFLLSPEQAQNHEMTLSMLANFHADPRYKLELGRIIEIGEPWIPNSNCDHLLISLPYTFGPKLELIQMPDFCVRIAWAIPITKSEAEFARRFGIEALEKKFDDVQLAYLDPYRSAVV